MTTARLSVLLAGCGTVALTASAANAAQGAAEVAIAASAAAQDLSELSIEELAQISVSSAAKQDQPLSSAATALFVITGEEITASSALSLPEVLRLAPNLQVQQVDARQYAITARGFNSVESSNKLLVLIDGRTVYSPLASTVFWELHNRPVEDIAQIEVISGPGGTLYGPNAVNGVVSINSRTAHDTIGGVVRAAAGENEQSVAARFGVPIGPNGAVRVYGTWFHRDALSRGVGPESEDRFEGIQGGFRADFTGESNRVTVQGDVFETDTGGLRGDGDRGHNLLGRWSHDFSPTSSLRVQGYYDYFQRDFLLVHDSLQTFDLEAQYNARAGTHDLVAGAGIRTTRDEFINNLNDFRLVPASRRLWVFNAFVQDRIALSSQVALIVGLKAEQSSFSGLELLPNVRLAWQPNPRALFWGAASRAVRTPSRIDRQLQAPPLFVAAGDFETEKLIAFEAGYRGQPTDRTSLSVSVFFNRYDDIRSTEGTTPAIIPIRLDNSWYGHSYGVEAWGAWQVAGWWRLNLGLATLWKDFELKPGRLDLSSGDSLGHDPDYQILARSQMTLAPGLTFNSGVRWVGDIEARSGPGIGDYAEADARLAYRPDDKVELFVAGRNLLHRRHPESDDINRAQLAQRSLYAGTRITF